MIIINLIEFIIFGRVYPLGPSFKISFIVVMKYEVICFGAGTLMEGMVVLVSSL